MRNVVSYFLFVALLLVACGRSEDEGYDSRSLDISVIDSAKVLDKEKIPLQHEFPVAQKFYVFHDSILVVVNGQTTESHLIDVYSLSSGQVVASLFRVGRGENEMLRVKTYLSGNLLLVYDFQTLRLSCINMDSLLLCADYKPSISKPMGGGSTFICPFKGHLIMENGYYFKDRAAGIDQGDKRFLKEEEYYTDEIKTYEYNTLNVAANGRILVHPNSKRVIYASLNRPFYEVYDEDLNLIKVVTGPNILDIRYSVDEGAEGGKEVTFKSPIPYSYVDYCYDERSVCFLYYGISVNYRAGENLEDYPGYIIETDWDGDFIKSYNLGGYAISISKSAQYDGVFYACMYDEEGLPQLYKVYENP